MKNIIRIIIFILGVSASQAEDSTDISIEELLSEKISTASKYEQEVSGVPASVAIITADELSYYSYGTLAEALNCVAGFFVRNDRNYTYLGTRGFDNLSSFGNKVLLLLDGHTMNDNVFGGTYYANDFGVNLDQVERIEIVRGPGSVIYGTGAMFAVINVITKKASNLDGLKLGVNAGSFGQYGGKLSFGKAFENGFEITASAIAGKIDGERLHFDEFASINNGFADNLDYEEYYGGNISLTYGNWGLNLYHSIREKGIPTAPWETMFNNPDQKTNDNRSFAELKYDKVFDENKSLSVRTYFDMYEYTGFYPYLLGPNNVVLTKDGGEGELTGTEAKFVWDIAEFNRIIAGAEYQYSNQSEVFSDDGFVRTTTKAPFGVVALYLQNTLQFLNNLSFNLGLRIDKDSRFDARITPRLGLVYNPNSKSTIKLLFGRAYRAPNTYELYYFDNQTAKGNKFLKPEEITSSEIVFEQKFSKYLVGTLSAFHYEMRNLIEETVDSLDFLTVFKNKTKANALGFELDLKARMSNVFHSYINVTFQNCSKGELFEDDNFNYPSILLKGGAYYLFDYNLFASFDMYYENGRQTVHESKTKPYVLSNLSFGYKPIQDNKQMHRIFKAIEIIFKIRNLFNIDYYAPGGYEHLQKQLIQPKRSFNLGLNYKF